MNKQTNDLDSKKDIKTVEKKPVDIKKEEVETKKNEFLSSMTTKVGAEAKELEEKIMHLPVNKKFIFFTGVVLIVLAVLSLWSASFSAFFILLIGGAMVYIGISKKNPITKLMEKSGKK